LPEKIADKNYVVVLDKHYGGWTNDLVPNEVLNYVAQHKGVEEVAHTDGYIYEIPFEDTKRYHEIGFSDSEHSEPSETKFWNRRYNHASEIKKILETNQPVKDYFYSLTSLIGTEVISSSVLPMWEKYSNYFKVPVSTVHEYGFQIQNLKKEDECRTAGLFIFVKLQNFCEAPRMDNFLLQLGSIQYEGIIHTTK